MVFTVVSIALVIWNIVVVCTVVDMKGTMEKKIAEFWNDFGIEEDTMLAYLARATVLPAFGILKFLYWKPFKRKIKL